MALGDCKDLKKLLGDTLMKDKKEVPLEDALGGKKVIYLYFSAHWCPPCRGFTPKLSEVYKRDVESNIKAGEKNTGEIEVVFISSDRKEEEFMSYFSEMPWYALPWEGIGRFKQNLTNEYKVRGIPKLVAIKPDGTVLNDNGREYVMEKNTLQLQK